MSLNHRFGLINFANRVQKKRFENLGDQNTVPPRDQFVLVRLRIPQIGVLLFAFVLLILAMRCKKDSAITPITAKADVTCIGL